MRPLSASDPRSSANEASEPGSAENTDTSLPAHIEETVRAISELHADHHRKTSPTQRAFDQMTRSIGRPRFIGLVSAFILTWIAVNLALQAIGRAFDPPPFYALQGMGTALGVYITVLILITQRRENELSEHREQLTLELAIVGEQKNAKLIQLIEELRRDSPTITDRHDPEAAAMAVAADPQAVLGAIKDSHDEMLTRVAAEGAPTLPPRAR